MHPAGMKKQNRGFRGGFVSFIYLLI